MSTTEQQAEAQPVVAETPEAAAPETTTEEKTNEPVEGGSVAAAAEDALLTNVTPTIFTALSFIAFVLFVIGTPLPWLRSDVTSRQQISLWSYEVETASGNQVTKVADFGCDKMKEYFRGAEAFSIITIFVSAVTVLVGVLTRFRGTSAKPLGTVFAFLTFLSSLVCWGIGVAAYRRDFCNQPTFDQQRFRLYTGAGLFVAGWVLSAVAFAISLKDIKVPKALP
ncbi:amastin, putative, partial [Bodo saltans]